MQLFFSVPQRRDNGVWSLPGGMVDPGEGVTTTLVRCSTTTIITPPPPPPPPPLSGESVSSLTKVSVIDALNMDVLLLKRAVPDLVNNTDLL